MCAVLWGHFDAIFILRHATSDSYSWGSKSENAVALCPEDSNEYTFELQLISVYITHTHTPLLSLTHL